MKTEKIFCANDRRGTGSGATLNASVLGNSGGVSDNTSIVDTGGDAVGVGGGGSGRVNPSGWNVCKI
jgi:hypothetical protein